MNMKPTISLPVLALLGACAHGPSLQRVQLVNQTSRSIGNSISRSILGTIKRTF